MTLSAGDQRRISGNASTGPGASQIVIIMKMQVSNVTCQRFRDMRYATGRYEVCNKTRLKKAPVCYIQEHFMFQTLFMQIYSMVSRCS